MFDIELLPQKVREIKAYEVDRNTYKIRLDANESFIPFPEDDRAKIEDFIKNADFNRYPDSEAEKLCIAFANLYNLNVENVVAGNGSDEIISLIMNTFLNKGEKIAVFDPEFSMYKFYATLSELNSIVIPKNKNFEIDFDLTKNVLVKENIKLLIISNPCNPTGILETKENLKDLICYFPKTIFIIDEAYMDFANASESFLSETQKYPNLIILKTLSKALSSAALRVGFAIGDKISIEAFKKVKSPYNLNYLSQGIASIILENKNAVFKRIKSIKNAKEYLQQELKKIEDDKFCLVPSQANFVLVKTKEAEFIYQELLKKGISVRYFQNSTLRISAGAKEETDTLIKSLSEVKNYENSGSSKKN